jgi:hypothetical protein
MRPSVLIFFSAALVLAQEPVAPTPESVGPHAGDNWSAYNIVNSFETGYRFLSLSGDNANYKSAVNYGNGIRLLGSSFSINSKTGGGFLFDDAFLTTEGLGGDPYENASFRVEKNRIYSYTGSWRSSDYFNPGLITDGGNGVHLQDTEYRSQDHNLTLFPNSAVRVFLGYSHDAQGGSGIATDQVFDPDIGIFPFSTKINRQRNEYRIGNELHWHHTVFLWTHAWSDFKDDSSYSLNGTTAPSISGGGDLLTAFNRTAPFHGTNPYWTAALFEDGSLVNLNARFTYTSDGGAFLSGENATGLSSFLAGQNRQITTAGSGKRPVATGNMTLSLFPTSKLTRVSHTSIYNVRTEGNNAFLQLDNLSQETQVLYFQSLGIRTFATEANATYRFRPWFDLTSGYEYSNRRINSVGDITFAQGAFSTPFTQTNELHSGNAGFHLRPLKPLFISVDGEIGRDSLPFTPKSDGNYHAVNAVVRYRAKNFQASTSLRENRNATSVTLSAYSAQSRTWSANASWTASPLLSLDASYSKLHVDTLGGINFFAGAAQLAGQSYYLSNLHTANIGVRLNAKNRFTLYLGGTLAKDAGDGRSSPTATNVGPAIPNFQVGQTFPIQYLSPDIRLSVRINERIRWNAGFQLFDYQANFFPGTNFVGRTGYTSLLWSF